MGDALDQRIAALWSARCRSRRNTGLLAFAGRSGCGLVSNRQRSTAKTETAPSGRKSTLMRNTYVATTVRAMEWDPTHMSREVLLNREWIVTNGLGGYASGTVSGAITRRYHGLLIAALPNPLGRTMMLNGLSERLRLPDRHVVYTGAEELASVTPEANRVLGEFRLEAGLPVGRYEVDGYVLEKRLFLPYRQNTVHVTYILLSGRGKLRLGLRPAMHFRSHDAPVSQPRSTYYRLSVVEDQFEITSAT